MFPIYICWDGSLRPAEQNAILRGVRETEAIFGCTFVCYGARKWTYGRYTSSDAIVRAAPRNEKGQKNASSILTIMADVMREWVEPGAMILFTSEDLSVRGINWCFGAARSEVKMTVQSVARYRGLSEEVMSACIRRTMRHELGHIFECAKDLKRSNTEMNLGEHCTNAGCSMCQTLDLPTLIRLAGEEDERDCFCEQCKADMRRFKSKFEAGQRQLVKPKGRRVNYAASGGIPHRKRM
ncbi:MAG: hypothetical protein Q4D22_00510 [Candidatus Saccharibacteria bacterium]|nr:hypothetical protein [Candidatus Saccharibacteria bacterium]